MKLNHTRKLNLLPRGMPLMLHCLLATVQLFAGRYKYAASTSVSGAKPDAKNCAQLLEAVGLKNWQIGHSKVFIENFIFLCIQYIVLKMSEIVLLISDYVAVSV